MHDASDGSQVGSCSREPPRGNQYLGRGQDAHHDSMGTALDDHRGGTVVRREVTQMAVNGHRRLAIPSHCGPRYTWPDGTSSLIGRHPATLRNCLILKQVAGCSYDLRLGSRSALARTPLAKSSGTVKCRA